MGKNEVEEVRIVEGRDRHPVQDPAGSGRRARKVARDVRLKVGNVEGKKRRNGPEDFPPEAECPDENAGRRSRHSLCILAENEKYLLVSGRS
jgi:hypothetical protein